MPVVNDEYIKDNTNSYKIVDKYIDVRYTDRVLLMRRDGNESESCIEGRNKQYHTSLAV